MLKKILLSICFLSLFSPFSYAETVFATGFASLEKANLADARSSALEDAKRVAIEQLLGAYVSARTETRNFTLASEKVFSTARGTLDSYQIVSEGKIDDSTYTVEIEAQINKKQLSKRADALLLQHNWLKKPRIRLLPGSAEGKHGRVLLKSYLQTLTAELKSAGFTVVGAHGDDLYASFTLASQLSVAVTQEEFQGLSITKNQLLVASELAVADSGLLITSETQQASAAGQNSLKKLLKAAQKTAKRVAQKIKIDTMHKWLQSHSLPVLLVISAAEEPALQQVKQALMQHVLGLNALTVESKQASELTLLADYQGWREQLYVQLEQLAAYDTIPFTIQATAGNRIVLQAK